jgi:hypothetical protein
MQQRGHVRFVRRWQRKCDSSLAPKVPQRKRAVLHLLQRIDRNDGAAMTRR